VQYASPSLICVDPARIDEFWPHVEPLIHAAIDRTQLTAFEDIEKAVLKGQQLLWLAFDGQIEAAVTTQLYHGACIVTACGGVNRERWLPLFEKIEQYAKDEGCTKMRIYGRKGWERVLDGYKTNYVIIEKELP
jgi:hypothetical protein